MEKGTSCLLPNPKVPFASEFVFSKVSEFWKSYFQCYSKSSLPLCNIQRGSYHLQVTWKCFQASYCYISNQSVPLKSNSLASLNYKYLILLKSLSFQFKDCYLSNHSISIVPTDGQSQSVQNMWHQTTNATSEESQWRRILSQERWKKGRPKN